MIHCSADLTAVAEAAERAIAGAGLPLFRRDTMLVRPVVLDARDAGDRQIKTVGLAPINAIMMRSFMEQAARFEKFDSRRKSWTHCKPPADVAELILARAGHLAVLRACAACWRRRRLRPDGSLLDRPGYDAGNRHVSDRAAADAAQSRSADAGATAKQALDRARPPAGRLSVARRRRRPRGRTERADLAGGARGAADRAAARHLGTGGRHRQEAI